MKIVLVQILECEVSGLWSDLKNSSTSAFHFNNGELRIVEN